MGIDGVENLTEGDEPTPGEPIPPAEDEGELTPPEPPAFEPVVEETVEETETVVETETVEETEPDVQE